MGETVTDECVSLIQEYMDKGLTDSLPIIPPTEESVAEMVAATGRPADAALGNMPPSYASVTVRDIAVNAVLAGCLPPYMPVLVAAVEAMLLPEFNLMQIACSTKGVAPLMIVNGPIRREIDLNSGENVFGPGQRSNSTIGRALRLLMMNVGGAVPGSLDRATLGHPGKYSYVIAESEETSPWTPLHVDHGFEASDSTVTLVGAEGPRLVTNHLTRRPEALLITVADALRTLGSFGFFGPTNAVVVLGPEHRDVVADGGFDKQDVQDFLYDACERKASELRSIDSEYPPLKEAKSDGEAVKLFESPQDIHVISSGGAGRFSAVCPGFSHKSYSVSVMRKIGAEASEPAGEGTVRL